MRPFVTVQRARLLHTVFLVSASQPDQANETSQVLSKLTKVSLQDGKHRMGVSTLFANSWTGSNQRRLRKNSSFPAVGSLHALWHDFLLFLPWSAHPSASTMWQIPRIILTHPSTSDEDVEPLAQSPGAERQHDFDILDRCVFFDNTFYPHWPWQRKAPGTRLCRFSLFPRCLFCFCNAMVCQINHC